MSDSLKENVDYGFNSWSRNRSINCPHCKNAIQLVHVECETCFDLKDDKITELEKKVNKLKKECKELECKLQKLKEKILKSNL